MDQTLTNVLPKMEPICELFPKMDLMRKTSYKVEYGIVTCTKIYLPHCFTCSTIPRTITVDYIA